MPSSRQSQDTFPLVAMITRSTAIAPERAIGSASSGSSSVRDRLQLGRRRRDHRHLGVDAAPSPGRLRGGARLHGARLRGALRLRPDQRARARRPRRRRLVDKAPSGGEAPSPHLSTGEDAAGSGRLPATPAASLPPRCRRWPTRTTADCAARSSTPGCGMVARRRRDRPSRPGRRLRCRPRGLGIVPSRPGHPEGPPARPAAQPAKEASRRARQLEVVAERPAPTSHRSLLDPARRRARPGDGASHHDEARAMGQAVERLRTPIGAL